MRHLKKKLWICWLVLTDQYTNSDRSKTWYLWTGYKDKYQKVPRQCIKIMFAKGK